MDRIAGAVAAATAALCLAGCGDPLVITGDAPGVMRVVAGTPEQAGDSLADAATESMLNRPSGVALGPDGKTYIADRSNSRIMVVTATGLARVLIDHSDRSREPRLREPEGITLDGAGGLLVADPSGGRVWRIDLETRDATPIAGTGGGPGSDTTVALETELRGPTGVAAAADGSVYVTERSGHRLRRVDPDGGIVTMAGDGLPGFEGDGGLAAEARLNEPAGLALAGGVLYIADSRNQRVRALDLSSGTIRTVAGAGGTGFSGDGSPAVDALLHDPVAVAVTEDRRVLFIADSANNRIRMVRLETGIIFTFAGTGEDAYSGDLLSASETSLAAPQGLAATPFNILLIADTGHHIVYRTSLGVLPAP